jgi:pyruvate kinase
MVCLTQSGSTGLRAARERPFVPVVALTASPAMARRLALVWGVHCVVTEDARDVEDMVDRGCRAAFTEGYARPGQRVVVVGGVPFGTPGSTNMLRIAFVGADGSGAL